MITEVIPSVEKDRSISRVIADIKSLFKGLVLIANVLPVFVGYWLALHFTNAAFSEHLDMFFLTMIGSTVLMAGALVLNNWYDVDIDTVMTRTQQRPTVTGRISLKTVLILGIALSIIGFVLLLFTTVEAAIYGFIGWFTYVILYTMWSKRRYTLNTVIGSVSGAVTPLIGWAAIAPAMHIVPIVLFIILFIWQIPHTFAIAMKKSEEYRVADVAMLPVVYGFDMTKRQMAVYIICLLPWPFYLSSLGMTFVIVATVLNLGWFVVSVSSSYIKDDFKWAQINFLYSVNYLAILFIMMFIATLPFFN
ncbi:heme o synthase [Sporosarcina siberiensis]|uniref:Protoheme IX farnesyltransferase n=1 Tax=Sporosarcina siberiensis TaxID=1365606 RepID=A0ABW4SEI3_9BACL